MRILVTGAAGFIGFHLSRKFLEEGHQVVGIDNLNDYYSPKLKADRLKILRELPQSGDFRFEKLDLVDIAGLQKCFTANKFDYVVNMAGQAGVRYSLQNPLAYVSSNLTGFANLLECCRKASIKHLVFASSSSVYGLNVAKPYSELHNTDHPVSLYAATKKSEELLAHSYAHLYGMPCTGLRFFTVYGPWGRPDMAPCLFTTAILEEKPIKLFNSGKSQRDFTYIDDIVECVWRVMLKPAQPDIDFDPAAPNPATSSAPWRIYNIGNHQTVELMEFISILESILVRKARFELLPMQPGDVESTFADTRALAKKIDFKPDTPLRTGLEKYVAWYKNYYCQTG